MYGLTLFQVVLCTVAMLGAIGSFLWLVWVAIDLEDSRADVWEG